MARTHYGAMLLVALTTLISAPVPKEPIFSADDVPEYIKRAGVTRTVYVSATVRPDGRVEDCKSQVSSGDAALDAYTCSLVLKRGRFQPARWMDGSPAYGVVRAPVTWAVSDRIPSEQEQEKLRQSGPADLEV